MSDIDELARIVWDYHCLGHELEKADCIFVLGSHDIRIADYGIDLWKQGWAPTIAFSGGVIQKKPYLNVDWDLTEADLFAKKAKSSGIPATSIIVENKSTNTGENFQFTAHVLQEMDLNFSKFIVVQKPYMERRTLATGLKHWPDKILLVTSPPVTYEEYTSGSIPKNQIIQFMVGDLQRIRIYPERGFQVPQEIPQHVWDAFEQLVDMGFNERLIK